MVTYLAWGLNSVARASVTTLERWQMNMIYQPKDFVLEREEKGFVHIYDGFDEIQVDQILDDKFERMERMMFTRVKLTDSSGDILLDPETGAELTADGGCD
jgi:hypothetical protein